MAELLRDFLEKPFEAQPMLIGRGILPKKGKLIMGGAPKIGKSFIVLNIAIDLAFNSPLFGAYYSEKKPVFPVYAPCRVLYVENEIGEQKLQERFRQILAERSAKDLALFIKSRDMEMRMDTPDGRAVLTKEIKETRPDVLIVDPLAQFHLSDENSSQMMGAIMRVGDRWIEEYGLSIIYIHHTGHGNPQYPRRGGDKLRGSSAIFAAADSVVLVDRLSAMSVREPEYRLDFELRHGEAMDSIFIKKLRDGRIRYEGENLTLRDDALPFARDAYSKL
jgi:RecA-family ATPase